MMYNHLLVLFVFSIQMTLWSFAEGFEKCSCYSSYNSQLEEINNLLTEYQHFAELKFRYDEPYIREKWEVPYKSEYKKLISSMPNDYLTRYPVFQKKIIIYDRIIDVLHAHQYEYWLNAWADPKYMWGHTAAEKVSMKKRDLDKVDNRTLLTKNKLLDVSLKAYDLYITFFENCLATHSSIMTLHDYSLFFYLNNDFEKSHNLMIKFLENTQFDDNLNSLSTEVCNDLGKVCIEAMNYGDAIKFLTESLKRDPGNSEVYFDRATAFFELGSFNEALNDYQNSKSISSNPDNKITVSLDFCSGIQEGLIHGMSDSMSEFVPSLLDSLQGVNQTLWAFSTQPKETSERFSQACFEMGFEFAQYLKSIDQNKTDHLCNEARQLYLEFDSLSHTELGRELGYIIGKYGPDIFAGGIVLKGAQTLKKLKYANRACNLEGLSASSLEGRSVRNLAKSHSDSRHKFLSEVSIHFDKQNKHVPGMHNYIEGKSIFLHPDPQGLLKAHAGKGIPIKNRVPGSPDFREKVNFGVHIGYHVDYKTGVKTATNYGEIRYSKTGAHIVPTLPE